MGEKVNAKSEPIFIENNDKGKKKIDALKKSQEITEINLVEEQLNELFEIDYPNLKLSQDFNKKRASFVEDQINTVKTIWVYMPWVKRVIHILREDDYNRIRTNRNKNLINKTEQKQLYDTCVGIFGLSVGNSIALALAQSSISRTMKLADFDYLSTANLNRLRASIYQVGMPKLDIVSQQLFEINPFLNIHFFGKITDNNIDNFFLKPVPNVVFDEIDDFLMKIKIRLKARELGVPVIMITSLGDNILIDIERFDLDPDLKLFNGKIGNTPEEILSTAIGEKEKIKYAIKLVGIENIPTRALGSLLEINRSLVGRPQLAGTILIDSGISAYLLRRLIGGSKDLPSGRYSLNLDQATGLPITKESEDRVSIIETITKALN